MPFGPLKNEWIMLSAVCWLMLLFFRRRVLASTFGDSFGGVEITNGRVSQSLLDLSTLSVLLFSTWWNDLVCRKRNA